MVKKFFGFLSRKAQISSSDFDQLVPGAPEGEMQRRVGARQGNNVLPRQEIIDKVIQITMNRRVLDEMIIIQSKEEG